MNSYFASHKEINLLNPEAHKIFRRLVEDIKIGIFMADAQDKIFYVNKAFAETFGMQNCSDAMGQNWGEVCFSNAEQYEEFVAKLSPKGMVKDFETVRDLAHGEKEYLAITADYIYSDRREKIGIHGFVVNISARRKLEEDIFTEHQKLEQILSFCNTLGDIFEIAELSEYIIQQTTQILDVRRCSLMFVDAQSNELYINASCGLPEDAAAQMRVRIGQPVAGVVALQNKAVWIDDIEHNSLFKRQNKKTYAQRAFMSAPLFYNKTLMGVLNVAEKAGRFNKIDLEVLETIALQSAAHINKVQTLNTFEQLSQMDHKTGLLNYRSFIEKMDEEVNRAKRYGAVFSLMMIDVDNFKIYNDTHGHPEGDRILKHLADIFKANLRVTEIICRYGGDEFAVIFPQTDLTQAAIAGEKIREIVAKEFAKFKISLSIGVTQFQPDSSKEALIREADQSLYRAKKAGRNFVSIKH